MKSRASGPVRDAERLGHRHEGQSNVVMQDEDCALVEREPAEGLLQFVAIWERLDAVRLDGPLEREDADGGRPLPIARRIRVTGVDEDPVGPGLEAVGLSQMRQLSPDGHEGVLQNVLGETRIAQDPPGDAEERSTDLVHQVRERLLVAPTGPLDEVSIHGSSR